MSAKFKARSRLANRTKYLGADHPDTLEARRDLAAESLAEYISRVVDEAPPLTNQQRARLATLLTSGAGDAG